MAQVGKWFGFAEDEIYDVGLRAFERGDYEEAAEAFNTCLQDASDPSMQRLAKHYLCESHLNSGNARLRDGSFDAAADEYLLAIALSPNYPDLHLSLARAFRGVGDRRRQLLEIDRALELNPQYVDALLDKGVLMYEQGNREQGLALVEKAISLDTQIDAETFRAVRNEHLAGQFSEAVKLLDSLRSRGTSAANIQARVAASHFRNRDYVAARRAYEQALAVAPGYADLRCKYGKVLLEMGETESAAEQLIRAVEINERYVEALATLGIAMARMNRNIEAGDYFAKALVLDPHHPVAKAESAKLPARRSMR